MSVRVRAAPSPHIWPTAQKMHLKSDKGSTPRRRPETATLERPLVLDPGLLRKVDMTRITRDRLMTIENLLSTPKKTRASPKQKEKTGMAISRSRSREGEPKSWEDDECLTVEGLKPRKNSRVLNATFRVRSHARKGLREVFAAPTQLQVTPSPGKEVAKVKSPKTKEAKGEEKSVEDVFGALLVSDNSIPSPCSTCGRSERPERLHAHPSLPQSKRSKLKDDQENTEVRQPQQRSSVMKPVAMKFRSGKIREKPTRGTPSPNHQGKVPEKEVKEKQKIVPLIRRETFKIERTHNKPMLSVDKKVSSLSPSRRSSYPVNPPPRRQALPRTPTKLSPREISPSPSPPPITLVTNPPVVHSASPRWPRIITCYLCQKQFGTASYPLHEPHCLQKWHRENQELPAGQQLAEPQRPADHGDWEHAWEVAQAAMVTCEGCSKTFLPHRLDAHLRVCPNKSVAVPAPVATVAPVPVPAPRQSHQQHQLHKQQQLHQQQQLHPQQQLHQQQLHKQQHHQQLHKQQQLHQQQLHKEQQQKQLHQDQQLLLQQQQHEWESDLDDRSERSVPEGPTSIHCHICGRVYNRAVIDRHEQLCLRRWQLEHSSRESGTGSCSSGPASAASSPPSSPRRRALVLCYLCGRQFGSASIAIHEPQCLRRWRQENDRLPAAQRRPEPTKPNAVYDESGQVDHRATQEVQWKSHLTQLVPCAKCARTFYPDRVAVHEKCCKGPIKH